jgi:hypothetical protein
LVDRFLGGYAGEDPKMLDWQVYMELYISSGGGEVFIIPTQ